MSTDSAAKPESIELRTDDAEVILRVVGGPHPYVWIGTGDGDFIDTIDVSRLREALNGVTRRAGR